MRKEKHLLAMSVYGALAFAVIAIVWGILVHSQMILFDGVYSLISVILSLFSLLSASYIQKHDYKQFPFGKEMLEPLVIIVKYFIILILCLFALSSAVSDLLSGGREVDPGFALLYAIVATVGGFIVYRFLKAGQKKIKSGFVEAESNQWLMDTLLSAGVMIGFFIAFLLTLTPFAHLTAFVDPLMVILVSGYFIKVPVTSIKQQLREVLEMSPGEEIKSILEESTQRIERKYQFDETHLRVSKVGSKLFIEVDFVVNEVSKDLTIAQQDQIREELTFHIQDLNFTKWLTVSFTNDRKWAIE
ncbi:cation diffusion facilitator family transporter [Alteribacter populi]|uniref:cation diffusion facilitator family transporter n=1 Tax=Alteribacter populi TaxID=2011011 RepID=UPI000BBA4B30|nr:cation diffusion facilitator family transporter [Alteribacter populi]